MPGRHFVDTFLLAQFYDVTARVLETYDLPDIAAHLHIPPGLRRSSRSGALSEALGASYFVQAKIFPYNYQDVIVRGSATKADALFLREYLRRRHSLPDLPEPRPFEGGYTDIFFTGVARNVWHCDVASLYPSLMLQFGCLPAADRLGIFRGILTDLRAYRLEAKQQMRAATAPATRASLQALQSTFKILINAMYGYLGFSQARFADYDAAADVTARGRALLRDMVARLQALGAQVIEIDTDGIYFVPPAGADLAELHARLAEILPPGIDVEFDEQYEAMFSYKAKNYALLEKEGLLILRGGALKSRGLEKFQRLFMEQTILLLMQGRSAEIEALRADFESKIRNRQWPIEWLAKTDTLQDSLAQYAKKIEGSSRNRAAAYELALKSAAQATSPATRSPITSPARRKTSPPTRTPGSPPNGTRRTAMRTSNITPPSCRTSRKNSPPSSRPPRPRNRASFFSRRLTQMNTDFEIAETGILPKSAFIDVHPRPLCLATLECEQPLIRHHACGDRRPRRRVV